jgi:hypothetical protein
MVVFGLLTLLAFLILLKGYVIWSMNLEESIKKGVEDEIFNYLRSVNNLV